MRTEERTGRLVKSVVSFRNFANTPENGTLSILLVYSPLPLRTASSSSPYLSIGDLPLSKTERESARNRRSQNVDATFVTDLWFLQAAELCNVCETKRIRKHVVKLLNRKNDDVDCRDCRGCCCDAERGVTALIAFNVSVNPSSLGLRLIYLQFRFVILMFRFIYAMVSSYSYWKTTRLRLRVK